MVFIFGIYAVKQSLDCKKIIKKIYTLENKKWILDFEIFRPLTNLNSLIAGATIYSWLLSMLERRYGFRASARVGKALI